jgi:hypothetical protein
MNLTQLRKESKKWQKELGLSHWKITVVWASPKELGDSEETVYGCNLYDPNTMESTILILHPKHREHDVVDTVVHELLHLFMFPLESAAGFSIKAPTDQWETAMEQTINKLSSLLRKEQNGNRREGKDCKGSGSCGVSGDSGSVS